MDAKTRWSSTYEMLSRLSILSGPVNEILEETNSFHLMLTPDEVEELEEMTKALAPLEAVTRFLCAQSTTILQAEQMINWAIAKLEQVVTTFSHDLQEGLKRR